jgi:hypothetical protein
MLVSRDGIDLNAELGERRRQAEDVPGEIIRPYVRMVSRDGIEPSTRGLKVSRLQSAGVRMLRFIGNSAPSRSGAVQKIRLCPSARVSLRVSNRGSGRDVRRGRNLSRGAANLASFRSIASMSGGFALTSNTERFGSPRGPDEVWTIEISGEVEAA